MRAYVVVDYSFCRLERTRDLSLDFAFFPLCLASYASHSFQSIATDQHFQHFPFSLWYVYATVRIWAMKLQFSTIKWVSVSVRFDACLCVCVFVNKWTSIRTICRAMHTYGCATHSLILSHQCIAPCAILHTQYFCVLIFYCNRFDILFHTSSFISFDSCYLKSHFRFYFLIFFVFFFLFLALLGRRSLCGVQKNTEKKTNIILHESSWKSNWKRNDRFWFYT